MRLVLLAGVASASAVLMVPMAHAQKRQAVFKPGTFIGKTKQETVDSDFRNLEFKVSKKGRVTLIKEPVVRRDFCTTVPVFTLDGAQPTKPLSRRGAFSFTSTFEGTKIDRIRGRFISTTRIEGTAVYNFQGSDLCSPGATKVNFAANRQKK